MAARAAVVGARSLEPLDFGSTADIIKLIPKDLFAELCERIIQHFHCQIPGVNTVELCQRFQTAGVEMNVADLAKIINVVSFLFSTAAKNNLSAEELYTGLGNAISVLPKHAVQVIRHIWNEQGKSIMSEDARNMATVGQIIDIQWKLGMAVSSDSCRSLKYPYVTMTLKVAEPSGQIMSKSFEMTIPQFQVCNLVSYFSKRVAYNTTFLIEMQMFTCRTAHFCDI
ncbi:COMM domain-containing protein 6 [Platysternon megacephalum]|uniref:COMM domain-containing protein 6 n=1 Tax=Platysternon megacephalum TaxID=55544 RepID=A0A4D9E3G4_9SAUR|nr:COMM domain-containing protein 6 [Platysternon megacephalum]